MEKAKALWHLSPTESQLLPVDPPIQSPDLVQINALYSLISSGTERLVAKGQVPVSQVEAMKVPYQKGSFNFPINYGYSLVGEVKTVSHKWQGQLVHLLHPHQNICWVKETDLSLVPKEIPARRATLASNMETVVNAIWDGKVGIGDRVLVAGFGIIGALLAQVLSAMPGIDLWVLEKDEKRNHLAKEKGFKLLQEKAGIEKFDLAFHTTSNEKAMQFCMDQLGFEGKLIELSWYGEKTVQLHLGGNFHSDRKQIISSQVGHLPSDKKPRWDFYRRKQLVYDLLRNPVFDDYIQRIIPFEKTPDFFQQLRKGEEGLPGVCITYD